MAYRFAVSRKAEKDIQSAYEWYEQRREGLGSSFLEAIDRAFISIKSNPLFYGFRRKNIRGYTTKNFPFIILFYVKGRDIRVVSVFHTSRK